MTTVSTQGWLTAYDAVDWSAEQDLPEAGLYFLYNDGDYAAPPDAYTTLKGQGKHVATICINAETVANELDFEDGNPNDPVPWAKMMRSEYGYTGVVYCSEAAVQTVLNLFNNAQEPPPYFRIADWTGTAPGEVNDYGAGTVGVQYTDQGDGGLVDISLVSPDYPVIGANITVPTPPPVVVDTDTYAYRAEHNEYTPLVVDGSLGILTNRALQYVVGAAVDGDFGQQSVRDLQTMLGVPADAQLGPVTIKALQTRVGADVDGVWGSQTTADVQRALNAGSLQ